LLYNLVLTIHILICITLIVIVLMQSSKGGGLAGAFGGGGDQTMFGGHETATFLNKATTYLAVLFMLLSFVLAYMTSKRSTVADSVIRRSLQNQNTVIPTGQSVDEILGTLAPDTTEADTTGAQQ
jgi:preprotein translocase subunit SecG